MVSEDHMVSPEIISLFQCLRGETQIKRKRVWEEQENGLEIGANPDLQLKS